MIASTASGVAQETALMAKGGKRRGGDRTSAADTTRRRVAASGKPPNGRLHKAPSSGKALFDPSAHAAVLAYMFRPVETDVSILSMYNEVKRLSDLSDKVKFGNIEHMLTGQALALQCMFTWFAMKAEGANFVDHMDIYAHLALKAQRQCRATVATLADIKNPARATFIKNTAGQQQVNIGATVSLSTPKKKSEKLPNELLRGQPHAPMDECGTLVAIPNDKEVEAVAPIDGSEVAGGQGKGQPKRAKARSAQC